MISRQTSLAIANIYTQRFTRSSRSSHGHVTEIVYREQVYDFLYANDYEAWFCNLAKGHFKVRDFKEWFMKIHTGEALLASTKEWSWVQREKLGQRLLRDLARDCIRWFESVKSDKYAALQYGPVVQDLLRRLQLDGYLFRDGDLLQQSADILNVEQEKGIL